jgi:hypothetical protein
MIIWRFPSRHHFSLLTVCFLVLAVLVLTGCGASNDDFVVGSENAEWIILDEKGSPAADSAEPTASRQPGRTPTPSTIATALPTITVIPNVTTAFGSSGSGRTSSNSAGRTDDKDNGNALAAEDCIKLDTGCDPEIGADPTIASGATSLTPVPTPVPSAASAPRFSTTPTEPFSFDTFYQALSQVEDTIGEFVVNWGPILREERERNRGDCGAFAGWHNVWYTQAPAFTDVPQQWVPLYYEYRVIVQTIHTRTLDTQFRCNMGTGVRGTTTSPLPYAEYAQARLGEMLIEALQLR